LAEARLSNAQNQLAAAQAALRQLTLTAPFAGTVGDVKIHSGEWVIPGQAILILVDLAHLRVETTDLSELDIHEIHVGQQAVVDIKALGQEINGRVSQIWPLANSIGGDVVYKTIVELDSLPEGLREGMSAEVQFEAGQ
jgi:multidrug resistance efflux pump